MKHTDLDIMARKIRKTTIEMAYHAGAAGVHVGGVFSCAELLAVMYGKILNIHPSNPTDPNRDRFILSKGHSYAGLYAALYHAGFLSEEELATFENDGGMFPAHSVKNIEKGIELSSGSLGLGFSFGIGEAISGRKKGLDYHVYVLLGNGECNEGSVWEAAMLAVHQKLDHLYMIIDDNHQQLDGDSEQILQIKNLPSVLREMGFETYLVNGHNIPQLLEVFEHSGGKGKPVAIVMDTVKGKGISFMENNPKWHHARMQHDEYEQAIKEIDNDN